MTQINTNNFKIIKLVMDSLINQLHLPNRSPKFQTTTTSLFFFPNLGEDARRADRDIK